MAEAKIADIGKYHIIELIGEGAMGVVYRANDSVLDRTVAIKVMNESIARQDDLRKRFLHEAQAAASLQHPNVVCIYDLGDFDGHLFIAMEFIQGVDLEKLLELGEPIALQARLDIIIDVLTGLTFAHKRGIIHRDIKPANIRVTEDGRAKIMDFGVAHLSSSSMTSTGSFLGTPSYMAPEQITEGKTSPATDIFAVGGVLYQIADADAPVRGADAAESLLPHHHRDAEAGERARARPSARARSHRRQGDGEGAVGSIRDRARDGQRFEQRALEAEWPIVSGVGLAQRIGVGRDRAGAKEIAEPVEKFRVRRGRRRLRCRGSYRMVTDRQITRANCCRYIDFGRDKFGGASSRKRRAPIAPPPPAPTQASRTAQTPDPLRGSARKPSELSRAAARAADPPRSAPPKVATKTVQQQTTKTVQQPPSSPAQPIVQPSTQNSLAQQQVVTSPPPAAVVPHPVQTQPVESPASSPAPAPTPPTTADIAPSVQAYARAIESKDIGAVRHAYPGLTSAQQGQLETFFQAARTINAKLRISSLDPSPNSAEARVVGSYDYVTLEGRTESRPVSFAMSLRREGSGWRVVSVH